VLRRDFVRTASLGAAFGIFRRPSLTWPSHHGGIHGAIHGAGTADDARFIALRDRYFLQHLTLNPVTSTYLGGDGYSSRLVEANGRLRDYSPNALASEVASYRDLRTAISAVDPASLSARARIDRALVLAQLDFMLREITERHYYQRAVDTYVAEPFRGVDWFIQQMTPGSGTQLGTGDEWALVVHRVGAMPAYLATAQQQLLAGKRAGNLPDHRMIERDGIAGAKANADYFRTTLPKLARDAMGNRAFASSTLTALTKQCAAAATAWDRFAVFMAATFNIHETRDRFACGEQEYAWRVTHVLRDSRTPAALFAYGAEQVALYTDRITDVARAYATSAKLRLTFGTAAERAASVRRVMEHLSNDAPRTDDELFRWYRETGVRAVAYGRERALFDIPADYKLDVVPTPPVLRSTIDAAYYPAPPFKKTGVGRFYLTPTGNDAAALRAQNRASVADTAVHEGFPGHDWHYKYMTQHARDISNVRWLTPGAVEDSSSMWSDSMAAEGWALYAEELMAEPAPGKPYGFYDAGEYLYELQGQLLRAVRVRVDVGIHTGRMSFNDAIDYFTEHVDFIPHARQRAAHDPAARASADGALRAIYRYSKWPTQAITYNLGKSAIGRLRESVQRHEGSQFSRRAFHERFMRMGTIPAGYFADVFSASDV